jgi:hypothetical protein
MPTTLAQHERPNSRIFGDNLFQITRFHYL